MIRLRTGSEGDTLNESESKRSLIGVTAYGRDDENRYHLFANYVESVRRAGAEVVLLPPGAIDIDRWLDIVDGVVFTGGGDVSPQRYGAGDHETHYMIDDERDRTEFDLIGALLAKPIPTLAICRGAQILNVALRGTLHSHLPDVFGEDVKHRLPPREPVEHEISMTENSEFAKWMGVSTFSAFSWHHQAIDKVGNGLEVGAHAADGVIEAIEKPDHHWLYGVQWHPELNSADDPLQQRIFDELVKATMRRT